jgi:glycolate oxidase subunit GlcD
LVSALANELTRLVGAEHIVTDALARFSTDASEAHGVAGHADAAVMPGSAQEVADVLAWCYAHDVAVVPRGGGSGYVGGAVPVDGGAVIALERLTAIRELAPLQWRAHVEAGLSTRHVQRLARENGLYYAPDPGAAEQSQIGGNVATNAGGPHAFKYGVTGAWVTGLEVAVAPGELIEVGGPTRKDVGGYDLRSLLIGSEGTLGVVTAVWLKLLPAPEQRYPLAAMCADARHAGEAIAAVFGSGVVPSAMEFLDAHTLELAGPPFPDAPSATGVLVIAEADGTGPAAAAARGELLEALREHATSVHAPTNSAEIAALWRWRDEVSLRVVAQRGGKLSEDVAVPVDRLVELLEGLTEIGTRHGLDTCSWGHAGDGNVHATFLVRRDRPEEVARAERAAHELFALTVRLGGAVSGEHGLGVVKRGALKLQWDEKARELHAAVKAAFDPKGLLNPGKKDAFSGPADRASA